MREQEERERERERERGEERKDRVVRGRECQNKCACS
jgi:hypothetical protein